MEFQTWMVADGHWKGQLVSPVVKGSSRDEVIEKLKKMELWMNAGESMIDSYTNDKELTAFSDLIE
jgi:hypothetical protein